jgi:putative ABC transport system permease protein
MTLGTSSLDWKLAGRMLVKYPGLSIIGGLTLAVAIGLGAAWFEITQQFLHPRLPLADGDRIVRIDNWDATAATPESRLEYFRLWVEQLESITDVGAYRSLERNLIMPDGSGQPETVAEISAAAFPLTRVPPLMGRTLKDADEQPGAPDVVVIGYDIWQSRFNGDRTVVGRTVRLGRTAATIVGVMPEAFRFPVNHQLWVPLRITSAVPHEEPSIRVFGRLANDATFASAQAEVTTIGRRMTPTSARTPPQLLPRIALYAAPAGNTSVMLRLSNIVAWLILAAAAANVATLMFARTATREAEIVVRNALGASRARVMMQLFIEAFVLCAAGALVGLVAASFALDYGVRALSTIEQDVQLPFWWQFGLGPTTIGYAVVLALGGAAVVSLLPALRATGPRVQTSLTSIASGSTSIRFGGVWSTMIVLQVATAALCLPLGVFAVVWTLHEDTSGPPFPAHEYLTFRPALDRDATLSATGELSETSVRAHLLQVYAELKRSLESEPAVAGVTFGNGMPGMYYPLRQVEAQRGTDPPFLVDANIEGDRVRMASVDVGFFDALRLPLVAGRAFHAGDVEAGNTVVINETLARNIGGNPVGVHIRFAPRGAEQEPSPWYEVVGVVRDAGTETPKADFVFLPVSAADVSPLYVAIHVRGDAAAFAPRLRALAMQVEPGLRLYELLALDEVGRRRERPEILGMLAFVAVTLLVMALSAAGLYSLMSVAVTRRTREIGIRLAIGASPRAVLAAIFGRAIMQVGIGIVLACLLLPSMMTALGISELKLSFVVQAMLAASAGMLLVGLAACGVPAGRALRIQATEAMRYGG